MNKNDNPSFYGCSDKKCDEKKYVKLKEIFVIPKDKKIVSDLNKMDKIFKKESNLVKVKKPLDLMSMKKKDNKVQQIEQPKKEIKPKKNYDDSMARRNIKIRDGKSKYI